MNKESVWLPFNRNFSTESTMRLFCFHHAGGAALMYRKWQAFFPKNIEICPIELPGRGTRISELPFDELFPLIIATSQFIASYSDKPYAFFGHSFGALAAFETVRQLRKMGSQPMHLFVSGRSAPHVYKDAELIHTLPHVQFWEVLFERYEAIPRDFFAHTATRELFEPILRADLKINDDYSHNAEPPLDLPITALGGMDDPFASIPHLLAWREQTTKPFAIHLYPGKHFYMNDQLKKC